MTSDISDSLCHICAKTKNIVNHGSGIKRSPMPYNWTILYSARSDSETITHSIFTVPLCARAAVDQLKYDDTANSHFLVMI